MPDCKAVRYVGTPCRAHAPHTACRHESRVRRRGLVLTHLRVGEGGGQVGAPLEGILEDGFHRAGDGQRQNRAEDAPRDAPMSMEMMTTTGFNSMARFWTTGWRKLFSVN